MKSLMFYIFIIGFFGLSFAGFSENKHAVIDAAINQFEDLKSHHYQKKTATGSFSVADTLGAIDYQNKKFRAKTISGDQLIEKIYSKNKKVYIYNGITEQWFQLNFDNYYFDPGFNKKKIFLFFNKEAQSNGFDLQFREKDLNNRSKVFFILESKIENKEKAKRYVFDNLEIIFGKNFSQKIKEDRNLLDDYLNFYIDDFTAIVWIRKKDFFLTQKKQTYRQPVGPGRSVKIEEKINYSDFNKMVQVEIPKIAKQSPVISDFLR
ncbi:MAG: hypothetical protein K9L61_02980 [Candidatus Omnitrophica bacterium]|nr:hypothetical protein [Candidatus Omnitrophota bacterium]